MNDYKKRFTEELLHKIFEIDKSDLDFGIYRIINIRQREITDYFENRLPKKITEILKPFASAGKDRIRQKISQIENEIALAGLTIDALPDNAPKKHEYVSLKKQLAHGADIAVLENDVYSALYSFFNRYYDEGDFISKRRYKEGVYAIPYEGEEVKLYWANQDQYYIKTSENFKDYSFVTQERINVHFRLVDATTEQNNNKETEDAKRAFMLYTESEERPELKTFEWNEADRELIIRFIYDVPADKKKKWDEANLKAIKEWLTDYTSLMMALLRPAYSGSQKPQSVIEKHLKAYVAKNTFDYFIHKDLGGFLNRELDFFIKNEIMHLDDLDTDNEQRAESYLAKVRAVKRIGKEIIAFLAQIENFQRKLWLKKKFVVETNWCVTLDRIDERFYPEIIACKAQVQEWIDMYRIDEIKGDLATTAFTNPPTIEFLRENQNLIVDTKFFQRNFVERLTSSIENLDSKTNGVMIHSDNSQGVRFLMNKYKHTIQSVYIDPPYNTPFSQILYKNNYKHSSWLSLLNNCIPYISNFWTKDFSFGLAIDDYEFVKLAQFLDDKFPTLERSVVVINHHPQGAGGRLSRTHEYFILLSEGGNNAPKYSGEPLEDYQEDRSFMRSGSAPNNYRTGRWKSFYALLVDPKSNKIIDVEDPVPLDEKYPTGQTSQGFLRIYPINSRGEERVWRSSYLTGRERAKNNELFISAQGTVYQSIDHECKRETLFSNWTDSKFNAGIYGANLLADMKIDFDYPKSINTMETCLWAQTFGRDNGYILDFFAGSGTTAHAVININRKFGGSRKYILIDMGEHFYSTIVPRVKKVVYSPEWKNGVPQRRDAGVSHIMKYLRLESYEDALSNISLEKKDDFSKMFGDEYLINYMLDIEAKGSLLNLEAFNSPFDYEMKITEKNECRVRKVDVVETFNYLIGLSVSSQSAIAYFKTRTAASPAYEGAVDLVNDNNGDYAFRQIEGTLPDGRRALVIWRNIKADNLTTSNAALDAYFSRYRINPQDREFDVIFVNGDSNVENLRLDSERWKVVRTETEFNRLMWTEQ